MLMHKEINILRDLNVMLDDYIMMLENEIRNKHMKRLERGFRKIKGDLDNYSTTTLDRFPFVNDFQKINLKKMFEVILNYLGSIIRDIQIYRGGNGFFIEGYVENMKNFRENNSGIINFLADFGTGINCLNSLRTIT